MDKKVGVVGLGIMGHGMAANFLKKGFALSVWNRTPSDASDLVESGAVLGRTPREVVERSDVVFEVTANDESSRLVWTGAAGMLSGADASKVLIASGTFSVSWIDELAALCASRNARFMDIPLTGGRIGAETGALTFLCGGDEGAVKELEPVFSAVAATVKYMGVAGQGSRYKLILNFMQALHIVGFAQAMKLAKANGMDLSKVAEALGERPGGVITNVAKRAYFTKPDPITFAISWMVKDLTYAKQFAGELDLTLLDDVLAVYTKAKDKGFGSEDWARISHLLDK